MKKFANLEDLRNSYLERGMFGLKLLRALIGKESSVAPSSQDKDPNSAWLLQSADNDATVAAVFGAPLMELPVIRVRYLPDEEQFLCELVREQSGQETLVIPDAYWLDDGWRAWLVSQL